MAFAECLPCEVDLLKQFIAEQVQIMPKREMSAQLQIQEKIQVQNQAQLIQKIQQLRMTKVGYKK